MSLNNYQIQRNKLKLYCNKLLYASLIPLLVKSKISPNTLTIIGFIFSIITMILISQGYLIISGILLIFSSIFDLLDGALARYTNNTTNFGKFIDAVIDRLSEIAIYGGLFIYFINDSNSLLIIFLSAISNQLVSYIKTKYESIGIEGDIGIFTRPERIVTLSLALIIGSFYLYIFYLFMYISILLALITIMQRIFYAYINSEKK
ncbi:MAG TPA: CDP-alcohol phosphatidyltransferase family protein [Dehalococcoidia bacterium]|nr:CDP-alcohol phosphatidyltransferase family protein [Dehalococcoidia bacterium]